MDKSLYWFAVEYMEEHSVLGALLAFRQVIIHFQEAAKQSVSPEQVRDSTAQGALSPGTSPFSLEGGGEGGFSVASSGC